LADGFEEVEAILTRDLLSRTKSINVDLISVTGDGAISNHGLMIKGLINLDSAKPDEYDFLVLPGGKKGVDNLQSSNLVHKWIMDFWTKKKLVAAICAAPSILGKMGLLDRRKYTCFPGFQSGQGEYLNVPAVKDQNLITGHSMGYTTDFAYLIIRYFLGKNGMDCIKNGVYGYE